MKHFLNKKQTFDWLAEKFINQKNGILFDTHQSSNFDLIQELIEIFDHPFKTSIIYYQAFPEESAVQFLSTLAEELTAKFNMPQLTSKQSLAQIIQQVELKTIVIDRCQLHPLDTLSKLLETFASFEVAVILVGEKNKMVRAQILQLDIVAHWERLSIDAGYPTYNLH